MFTLGLVVFLFLFAIVAFATNPAVPTTTDLVGVGLLLVYSFYLLSVAHAEYKRGELASPLALFCYGSLLYFGLSGVLYYDADFFQNQVNRQYYIHSILYIILYSLVFHMACIYLRNGRGPRREFIVAPAKLWSGTNVFLVVLVILIAGWIGRAHIISIGVYLHAGLDQSEATGQEIANVGLWRFLEALPDVAGWITWTYYLGRLGAKESVHPVLRYVVFGLLLSNLVYWLPTATKYQIAQAIIVPVFIQYLYTRAMPKFRYIVILGALLAAMFPLTYQLRNAQSIVFGRGLTATSFSRLVDLFQISSQYVRPVDAFGGANGRLFGRFDEIEPVAGAVRIVNDGTEPLHLGTEYLNFLINLIPRAFWPHKPNVSYGNHFGHLIGVLNNLSIGTSIAPTLVGESYLNFADFGLIVAALLAAIYFFMYRLTWTFRARQTACLLYATAIPTMLYMDASFALYFSGLLQLWIFIALLGIFMDSPTARLRRGGPIGRLGRRLPGQRLKSRKRAI
jgi:hypothetical protein